VVRAVLSAVQDNYGSISAAPNPRVPDENERSRAEVAIMDRVLELALELVTDSKWLFNTFV
jgi:hypothetical protein